MTRTKTQYHISKDGEVRECKAKGVCPLGGKHFDNRQEAESYAQKDSEREYGVLPEIKGSADSSDTKMKKYIFVDGTEIRGVIIGTDHYNRMIIDETATVRILSHLPPIEKETFVRGVDPKIRETLEAIKASSNKQEREEKEIQALEEELRQRKQSLKSDVNEQVEKLKKVYKEVSGVFPKSEFEANVSDKAENFLLSRFPAVSDGISSERPSVWVSGNKVTAIIPVAVIRHPSEGDWDFYREYDGTLHSNGTDMTKQVKQYENRVGFNLENMKKKVSKPSFAKSGEVFGETSLGDKTASLDLVVRLEYKDNLEYSQDNINNIVKEIEDIFKN